MNNLFKEVMLLEKKKGEVIIYEGNRGRNFFIIIEGKVEVL